jgi:integrase
MAIYRRKSGRYAVAIDLDPTSTGKRRRLSLGTFPTKKEAERAAREALGHLDHGINLSPQTLTLRELADRFLADRLQYWEPKTFERSKEILEKYIIAHMPNVALAKLRPHHIQEWVNMLHARGGVTGRPLSKKSVRHAYNLLRQTFNWAVKLQLVVSNVTASVDPPRVPRHEAAAFSVEEIGRLRKAAANSRLDNLIVLALCTGARRGELAALKWTDVRLEAQQLIIQRSLTETRERRIEKSTKTGRSRVIPLSEDAATALRSERARQAADKLALGVVYDDSGHIFQGPAGGPLRLMQITDGFRKIARRATVSITSFHALRHTTATWVLSSGGDIRATAGLLGHTNAATTLGIYAHVLATAQVDAVNAVDRMLRSTETA